VISKPKVRKETCDNFERKIELQGLFMKYQLSSNKCPLVSIAEHTAVRMNDSGEDSTFLWLSNHGEAETKISHIVLSRLQL
jgi:hypothetical protein